MLTISNMPTAVLRGQMFSARSSILENSKESLGLLLLFLPKTCLYLNNLLLYINKKWQVPLVWTCLWGTCRSHKIPVVISMMTFPMEFPLGSDWELDCSFFRAWTVQTNSWVFNLGTSDRRPEDTHIFCNQKDYRSITFSHEEGKICGTSTQH